MTDKLEPTRADSAIRDVDAKDEWAAFRSWWMRHRPGDPVPSPASLIFDAWMQSARHRTAHSGEGRSYGAGENAVDPMAMQSMLIERICLDVAELPDRSSPDDWPDAMLVTGEELAAVIRTAFDETNFAALTPQGDGEIERLREALAEAADKLDKLAGSMREEEADLLAPEIAVCELAREECRAALQRDTGGER